MTTGKETTTPLADAQKIPSGVAEMIDAVLASGAESKNPKAGIDVSTSKTKLTTNTALAIMQIAAESAGYAVKFSKADVQKFMDEFDAEQSRQISKVITSTSQKLTPGGTTPGAIDKTASSVVKTEFPSFFKPGEFALDWVWKRVDFNNEATLGAKSLGVLKEVRGLINNFNIVGVSDLEAKAAAKAIAKGDMTLDDYTVKLQGIAIKEYPQFASRFAENPKLTVYDIASPVINMVAKTLQVDPKTIGMNHPLVRAYTHYAGADGKGKPPSFYELELQAKALPEYQYTEEANTNARSAASALGSAMGFGG